MQAGQEQPGELLPPKSAHPKQVPREAPKANPVALAAEDTVERAS